MPADEGVARRDPATTTEAAPVTVTFYEDGPMLVRGPFVLRTPEGEVIDPGRATVALCRCGRSAIKPFCDGSHKLVRFRATASAEARPITEPPHGDPVGEPVSPG